MNVVNKPVKIILYILVHNTYITSILILKHVFSFNVTQTFLCILIIFCFRGVVTDIVLLSDDCKEII